MDPETATNTALGNALVSALTGVSIPVDQVPVVGGVLTNAGITNVAALLALLGSNLDDPLGLTGPTPGLNIITAGPPFSLMKFLATTWVGRRDSRTRWPTRSTARSSSASARSPCCRH